MEPAWVERWARWLLRKRSPGMPLIWSYALGGLACMALALWLEGLPQRLQSFSLGVIAILLAAGFAQQRVYKRIVEGLEQEVARLQEPGASR